VHPFGRIPALRDGDLRLLETSAIVRYPQESFPGPALLPGNIRDRARVEAWVSAINSYYDAPMIRNYVLQYRGDARSPEFQADAARLNRRASHPRTAAIACAVRSTLSVLRPATHRRPERIRYTACSWRRRSTCPGVKPV